MIAARKGHQECLAILLAHGAEVNFRNVCLVSATNVEYATVHVAYHHYRCFKKDGYTALMIAAAEGHHECLLILLTNGADVDSRQGNFVRVCRNY